MERGLRIPQQERTKTTNALLISLMNQLEKVFAPHFHFQERFFELGFIYFSNLDHDACWVRIILLVLIGLMMHTR